ncbi:RNA polymerase sigma factor [Alicyclobacillus sp. SO9]|uniref:RNA polymerase sigma factor n=1 Tax=Alicyclobacillus sp. SO9 TaxID=2665646 RepID=UPI0018E72C8C|nr:RNA polymerase sigma factor [Alicyclobacillus sp. SO9]QQE78791.1 RNA polymerase sigma factor [Alicyclobacillus sp. SO9]
MDLNLSAAEATQQLYELYKDDLYRYIRFSLGDPHEALDLVQDVFIRVLHSWDSYRGEAKVKSWIWSIARNRIIDYTRKRKNRTSDSLDERFDVASSDSSYGVVELETVIRNLPNKYREVVILRLLQDWSTADAAQILGWSQAKVRTMLHRAMKELRSELKGVRTEQWNRGH